MPFGYCGRLLWVDLSSGSVEVRELSERDVRLHMGGAGLAGKLLWELCPKGVDPLSPENPLLVLTGVLTGFPLSGMCRFVVSGKSPLTGAFGVSDAGGFLGPELKRAGFDGIVVLGKAPRPVFLWVRDGEASIEDASDAWGLPSREARDLLLSRTDPRSRVMLIGPAGERGVRFACISNELRHYNGRNGMGALMGSKMLKAVVVRGSGRIEVADPQGARDLARSFDSMRRENPLTRRLYEFGTSAGVTANDAAGLLPTRHFLSGSFEGARAIGGEAMNASILVGRESCFGCAVRCKRAVSVPELGVDPVYGGPEYETLAALGSLCGVDDLKAVALGNQICNAWGMDTISAGVSIAFAMELFERGVIGPSDTDGVELRFGNAGAMLEMLQRMARREGFGALLGEGVERASRAIGRGAERYALHVKGQEVPMHEPRGKQMVGMGYALCEHGADHMVVGHDTMLSSREQYTFREMAPLGILDPTSPIALTEEKVRQYHYLSCWWSFFDCAGVCKFVPVPRSAMPVRMVVEALRCATGWDTSLFEVLKAGERAIVLGRLFNAREGFTSADDELPSRFFEPLGGGALEGTRIDRGAFERARGLYYRMAGLDEEGRPTEAKLVELSIPYRL